MKKVIGLFVVAVPVIMISCQKGVTTKPEDQEIAPAAITGNGAPSGTHYNLNIIGVKNPKSIDSAQGNGRRIFVLLGGEGQAMKQTKILLREGDFDVLDPNGTDGSAAFQLPKPDANNDLITDYSVFIRGLGKTGGHADMQSCFFDQQTQTEFCSTDETVTVSIDAHGNNNKFTNVSNQLLFVWADTDGDGDLDRTPLFADPLDEFYWYYDNQGLKIAQLRFYPNYGTPVMPDPEPVQ